LAAPLAGGLAWPLVRRIEAELGAEACDRAGEIEVSDRRVVDDHGVARRVDARGDCPDHLAPVANVDVGVDHDDELGVGELAQVRPDAHHCPPRVAGVLLADRDHGDAVRTRLLRQVEVDDLSSCESFGQVVGARLRAMLFRFE